MPAASVLLCLAALSARAQTTYSGGGAISIDGTFVHSGNSSTIPVTGAAGSVKTISVTLDGVTSQGPRTSNNQAAESVAFASFVLESPGGQKFVLLGCTGDSTDGDDLEDTGNGLDSVTINIADANSSGAPQGNAWQHTGTANVKPSSYWLNNNDGCIPLSSLNSDINGDSVPQTDGSATLNGTFAAANPNGTWTLYIFDDDTFGGPDPISISSWSMTMTFNAGSSDTTSTTVSSNVANPGSTTDSYALTATVTDITNSGTTVGTGTVAFSANGSTISGCSAQPVSGGTATCNTSFPAQGLYPIVAAYTAGTGFESSTSGTINQIVENPTTEPATDTWCNTGSFTIPGGGAGLAYPSVIKVTGYAPGTTVANVEVELNGVTNNVNAEHLLVSPTNSYNLDFFDTGFNQGFPTNNSIALNFDDSAGQYPNSNNGPTAGTYEASDTNNPGNYDSFPSSLAPTYDTSIPQVPGTVNYGYDPYSTSAHGPITATFENNFNGAPANGTWALYTYQASAVTETIGGGWCVAFTLNSGASTTTTLSSNANPQVAQTPVTLTAAVKAGGAPVTSGGTVTFQQNGGLPSGITSPNNVVNVSTTNGQAALTTGTVSSSIDIGAVNGTGPDHFLTVYEGDYEMSADYSGVANEDAPSTSFLWQRFDDTTAFSAGAGGSINACNTGPVLLDQVNNKGPFYPNPSNIFVSGLPGTVNAVTLSLNGYYTSNAGPLQDTESLLAGPTGAALDFFSNTGDATTQLGTTTGPLGTLTFSDAASSVIPSSGNFAAGSYKPTAYQGSSSTDSFTSSSSGFYNVPGSFTYAQPHGSGTLASTFGGTNPNGTWSLFFNATENVSAEGAQSGWCMNFSENPVAVSADESHSGTGVGGDFVQGETGAQITTVVTNNGPGPTGDPLATNPLTVVDTLNSAFTYQSFTGTGWSCSAAGQTVTCTNESPVASSNAYPTLTLNVNVSSSASGTITNSASISGAGVTSTTSNTDNITVEGSASLAISKFHTGQFTQGSAGTWSLVVENNAATGSTSGTVTVADTLPTGYTLATYSSSGSLFTCSGTTTVTCTGAPGFAAGGSSTITLTVNIPANSPTSVSNTALTWGGGDPVHTSLGTAAVSNTDTVSVTQVPASISVLSGNNQSSAVGDAFANSLTVQVKDAGGLLITGASVAFTAPNSGASGTFSDSSNIITGNTDLTGRLSESFKANTIAGAYTVIAQAGVSATSFSLTNTAGNAVVLSLAGGNNQSAYVQTSFSVPLSVTVADTYGNPVSGVTVTFSAPSSGASASLSNSGSCTTAANGGCSVTATANGTAGSYSVSATATGLGNVAFSLTNNPAPNYVVNTTGDDASGNAANCPIGGAASPECTLRDALAAAASAGIGNITFDPLAFPAPNGATITLGSAGSLAIPSLTTIQGLTSGSGASLTNLVTVSGGGGSGVTVFTTNATKNAVLENLNITGGNGTEGGGIMVGDASQLTVNQCNITGNTSTAGGGIYNLSTLTLENSTVSGNTAGLGGGIDSDAAATQLTVIDSTISGNHATGGSFGLGGGIFIASPATVTGSTIAGNSVSGGTTTNYQGGGVLVGGATGVLTMANSIVAGNSSSGSYADVDLYTSGGPAGTLNDNGGNLDGTASSGTSQVNAGLAPMANYGGPTQTMIPVPPSAAICTGSSTLVPNGTTSDQRGVAFGSGGYCPSGAVDAGAVQTDYAMSFTVPPSNVAPNTDMNPAPAITLDESGTPFVGAAVTIPLTLASTPPGATLGGGSVSTSAGVATYSALTVNQPGTGDQLIATLALNTSATALLSAASGNFNVSKIAPSLAFAPNPASQTYGTAIAASSLGATASYNSTTVPGTFAYTTTVNGNPVTLVAGTTVLPAATYTITATFTPTNPAVYTGASTTATYTVNAAPLTITASSATMSYGGTVPTITPSYSGFVNGDSATSLSTQPSCSTSATSHSAAATYPSSCSGAVDSNYTITYTPGSVTVGAVPLTITASSATMTYGGTVPVISAGYSGFVNGDSAVSLAALPTCSTTATSHSAVGAYASSCSGAVDVDYTISYTPGSVTVSAAALTIAASSSSITYGGAVPAVTASYSGFVNGDSAASLSAEPVCSTTATSHSAVGTYVSSCSGAVDANYSIAYTPGSVTVGQAALAITASSGSMTYGSAVPIITPSYSGFVSGDNAPSLSMPPTCSTTATSQSVVGTYPSSCYGAAAPNYFIGYTPGSVIVSQATPTIALTSSLNPAGLAEPLTFAATVSSPGGTPTGSISFYEGTTLLGTEMLSSGVATYATNALALGSHTITAQYSGDPNFTRVTSSTLAQSVVYSLLIGPAPGAPSSANGVPGSVVTFLLSVTPPPNSSAYYLISGLPAGSSATFSPNNVPAGAGPTEVELTISIPAQSAAATMPPGSSPSRRLPVFFGLMLLPLLAVGKSARRASRFLLLAVLALAASAGIAGCQHFQFGNAPGAPTRQGTYTLTVTATAGSQTQSTALTLNVQ